MLQTWDGVRFTANNGNSVACRRFEVGLKKSISGYFGAIECPPIDKICGETPGGVICGLGHWSEKYQRCICRPGYTGDRCAQENRGLPSTEIL